MKKHRRYSDMSDTILQTHTNAQLKLAQQRSTHTVVVTTGREGRPLPVFLHWSISSTLEFQECCDSISPTMLYIN